MNLQKGEIRVVENILGSNMEDAIQSVLLDPQFSWNFIGDLTSAEKDELKDVKTPGYRHEFFNSEVQIRSPWFFLVFPIFANALDKIGLANNPRQMLQARTFMQKPSVKHREYDSPHIDDGLARPLVSVLYYVNNSDGDTFFFDQTAADFPNTFDVAKMSREEQEKNFTIKTRVTPKKGKCVIFDGLRYHASSSPQNGNRCIVNFSYVL